MSGFTLLLFFGATGLTLNHAEWFAGDSESGEYYTGSMNEKWLGDPDEESSVSELEVVEFFRNEYGVGGAVTEFIADDYQVIVSFRGPGYLADAFIDRESCEYELSESRLGLVAVMNDLHKGRDSGTAWSWVIDISAVVTVLLSVTGFALIFYLKRRLRKGMIVMLGATIIVGVVFWLMVP